MAARATLRLGLSCNNRCIFCAQRGLVETEPSATLAERLAALQQSGVDALTFIGGEPTLVGDALIGAVASARAAGFRRVGVQTNGRLLAPLAAPLAAAGLTDVHVSLHGAAASIHDYHTGVAGSFAALLDGVRAARAAGLVIVATTLVTRSSFRTLAPLPSLLRAQGVAAWTLALPLVAGAAAEAFDRVVPRLGLALPFALHALDAARRLELPAWIRGAPRCALGPFAGDTLDEGDAPRAFAPRCDGCPARAGCAGVDARYLDRFGDGELRHVPPPPAVDANDRVSELRRLFVGAGELAPLAPLSTPRHTHLPLAIGPGLGRVQPARAEVSPAAPRQTGEALRAILPGLFVDEKS